jgi:hypothetical protein
MEVRKRGRRRLGSLDMLFKQGAKLIYLMMGIDGGSMARKLSRIIGFREATTGVLIKGVM